MPSAALRPKNPCQASLIEGWSVGVPGRTPPATPGSGCGTLLTLPASGGGPLLTPPPLAGEGGGNKRTGRPHSTPSQLVTCIISGALVEGGPNAIAAFRRILEHSASQILPMAGTWAGRAGRSKFQALPPLTLPRKQGRGNPFLPPPLPGGAGGGDRLDCGDRSSAQPRQL